MSAAIGRVSVTWNSAAIHAEPPRPLLRVSSSTATNHNKGNRTVGQTKARQGRCQVFYESFRLINHPETRKRFDTMVENWKPDPAFLISSIHPFVGCIYLMVLQQFSLTLFELCQFVHSSRLDQWSK